MRLPLVSCSVVLFLVLLHLVGSRSNAAESSAAGRTGEAELSSAYGKEVRPLLARYCLGCHSTKDKKGELDLERFADWAAVRTDQKPWASLIEQLEMGEMPPKDKPQPTAAEKLALVAFSKRLLDFEARARAGDPGGWSLRRLSNAEYNNTIRDLTGVDLKPAADFPADGAAGEGFTNAAEALRMSPGLLTKYLAAAKEVAAHAVLLDDGFRFSPGKTRRDWTDESVARLREFYRAYPPDGKTPIEPYLRALVGSREALASGATTIAALAEKEKLSPKYLGVLWTALAGNEPTFGLDELRARFRVAGPGDVKGLVEEIAGWQAVIWKTRKVGSQTYDAFTRQAANDPKAATSHNVSLSFKPPPGQAEATVFLTARDVLDAKATGQVIWRRPRLEAGGKPPLLLRDYADYGGAYEVHFPTLFATTQKYLAAAAEVRQHPERPPAEFARAQSLDAGLLTRWCEVVNLPPLPSAKPAAGKLEFVAAATAVKPLTEKSPPNPEHPAIQGWRKAGTDLPVLVVNPSDKTEQIPGRITAHGVGMHPMPQEFVAVVFRSPIAGKARVTAKVSHAHPTCGNGVGWWVEQRREGKAAILGEGGLELGQEATLAPREIELNQDDEVMLSVDAKDANHFCDMTEISLSIAVGGNGDAGSEKVWNLAKDVSSDVHQGNPHADKQGHERVWSFVYGASPAGRAFQSSGKGPPAGSLLAKWREAAIDPAKGGEAADLAGKVQALLTGAPPADAKNPDRALYDQLVTSEGPLLKGLDVKKLAGAKPEDAPRLGLAKERFGPRPGASDVGEADLVVPLGAPLEIRLPAALLAQRSLIAEGQLADGGGERLVQFQMTAGAPGAARWDGVSPLVGGGESEARKKLAAGSAALRRVFPLFVCFPRVIPDDEVVCLKAFHREDGPLLDLFLSESQTREIERLWLEHKFISRFPFTENEYLPLFIGFVTQDQPKEMVTYFESQREPFRQRAEAFLQDEKRSEAAHLAQLAQLADRAYRRPLSNPEREELATLYRALRSKGLGHEDAFRAVLARVLSAPSFLYHLESPPPGAGIGPVNDWELASRLSYFLWASMPDEELRQAAAAGRLHEPAVLSAQTKRMLADPKVRSLATEFGTQWIHVNRFDELKEKSEKLFPSFDEPLRRDMFEESILLFQEIMQHDRPLRELLDADYTFLSERLAKHYGIPGVSGKEFRRVEGVKKYGRGGILGLASVQTKQAGASRTSPVLRGNWVVETLLGEKLPRPPPNVPRLPEEETNGEGLSMRKLVERHVSAPECATCHRRIDPYGFSLEHYDPIGRYRDKDSNGLAIDAAARLRDGTEFKGIEGLRGYLLGAKKEVVLRLFCRRLLGYAVDRTVMLSDQPLLDEMFAKAAGGEGRFESLVLLVVQSPQFVSIRGREFAEGK